MTSAFLDALDERVLVLDGAMGTSILDLGLDLQADFRGVGLCYDLLNETRPDKIRAIHDSFLKVGCDAIETNTFCATPLSLAPFELRDEARALNLAAARIAREAAEAWSTREQPRFVVGSIGPGSKLPTLGQVDVETLEESYAVQTDALVTGGVDALLVETCQDPLQMQAAISASVRAREAAGRDVPILVSITVEVTGKLLVGTELSEVVAFLEDSPVAVVALNCATGPREMEEHVHALGRACTKPIGVYPNAGLPQIVDGAPHYPLTPGELADWLTRFVEQDGVRLVGGCCGTTPAHLKAVVNAVGGRRPVALDALQPAEIEVEAQASAAPHASLAQEASAPEAPFLGPRIIEEIPLKSLLPYVNEATLFQFHWDFRRKGCSIVEYEAQLEDEVRPKYHALAERCAKEGILAPSAAYGYWRCKSDGDQLVILDPRDERRELARIGFPRQREKRGLCITDYFSEREPDLVALQVSSVGASAFETARQWFDAGRTAEHQQLTGFATEIAAACEEYVHRQIRGELGIAGEDARDTRELLKGGYRGGRFPFSCSAAPGVLDLRLLLDLLGAARIGVTISETGRLEPEPAAAGIVCHHPAAEYFTI